MGDDLDLSNLKKKKKKKPIDLGEETKPVKKNEDLKNSEANEPSAVPDDLDFGGKKKKKKKGVVKPGEEESSSQPSAEIIEEKDNLEPWVHSYDDLLKRVYDIIREKNPGFESGEKKKIMMKPPQVARVGSKKTAFSNFLDTCKTLKREPKHVLQFLLAELGTSGSVDGNNQLIIKGRFQQKQFESVLRNYIKEYVSCHTCKSPDTVLQKESETRLYFLKCGVCGSRCSVVAITTGFKAVTGKRAAARAAAGI